MSTNKTYAKSIFKSEGIKNSVIRFKNVTPMQLHIEVKEDGKVAINNHYHNGVEFTYSADNISFTTDAEQLEKFAKECLKASQVLKKIVKVEKAVTPVVNTATVASKAGAKEIEITPELEVLLSTLKNLGVIDIPQKTKGGKKGK